jgi:hypothetical protein
LGMILEFCHYKYHKKSGEEILHSCIILRFHKSR